MLDEIFKIINSEEYELNKQDLFHLSKLKSFDFYNISSLCSKIILHDFSDNETAVYKITHQNSPQVIDPVPIVKDEKLTILKPVVVLPDFINTEKEKWIVIHEFCHLLSIGKYVQSTENIKLWEHNFGINQYHYLYDNNKLLCIDKTKNFNFNELLNDAVTWHFVETINGYNVCPPDEYILKKAIKIKNRNDIKEIINFYFTGKINELYKRIGKYYE